jgi:hypothetical protein
MSYKIGDIILLKTLKELKTEFNYKKVKNGRAFYKLGSIMDSGTEVFFLLNNFVQHLGKEHEIKNVLYNEGEIFSLSLNNVSGFCRKEIIQEGDFFIAIKTIKEEIGL